MMSSLFLMLFLYFIVAVRFGQQNLQALQSLIKIGADWFSAMH